MVCEVRGTGGDDLVEVVRRTLREWEVVFPQIPHDLGIRIRVSG